MKRQLKAEAGKGYRSLAVAAVLGYLLCAGYAGISCWKIPYGELLAASLLLSFTYAVGVFACTRLAYAAFISRDALARPDRIYSPTTANGELVEKLSHEYGRGYASIEFLQSIGTLICLGLGGFEWYFLNGTAMGTVFAVVAAVNVVIVYATSKFGYAVLIARDAAMQADKLYSLQGPSSST
jgi:hypothetical protein